MNEINWEEIAKELPTVKDTRLYSSPMTQMDFYLEKAWCNVANRSVSADVQSLLTSQLRRHREARLEAIQFLAAQNGMTFEECFIKLAKGEFKPEE